ncbi:MAG: hypothetical protein A2Y15_07615 [Clostridiales bacterium GWF2_36_10]|nr:MAG: hypothetical protein A2Y15_07615 [Clostridiales bacterium GWF2_36_10]HAN22072.1 AbrB family transcriptional regulator [Clostridiales bacterium]
MQNLLCTRKIDEFGRISLPYEARNILGILQKQNIDIFIDSDAIILKKNNTMSCCVICGGKEELITEIGSLRVCRTCAEKIRT